MMAKQQTISGIEAMLVARGLTAQHNVRVTMASARKDLAYTHHDGDIYGITIPASTVYTANAMEYTRGYLDHECAHVRFTDFDMAARDTISLLRDTVEGHAMFNHAQVKSLYNSIEDARIEHLMSTLYPGSRRNLCRLNQLLFDDMQATTDKVHDLEHNNDLNIRLAAGILLMTDYVLTRQYEYLYNIDLHAQERWDKMEQALYRDRDDEASTLGCYKDKADDIARRSAENKDQRQVVELCKDVMRLCREFLEPLQQYVDPDCDESQRQAMSDLQTFMDGLEAKSEGETPSDEFNDLMQGNAKTADNRNAQEEAASERRQAMENLAGRLAQKCENMQSSDKAARAFAQIDDSNRWYSQREQGNTKEAYEDADLLGSLGGHCVLQRCEGADDNTRGDAIDDTIRAEIRTLAIQTGVRLRSLLQSMQSRPTWSGERGIKLDQRALYRPSIGDARVFRRCETKPVLETDIILLLDTSGSMMGENMRQTFSPVMGTLMALRSMPRVRTMLATFGNGFTEVALDWQDKAVVGTHMPYCTGGTPTGPSMMCASSFFDPRRTCRKLMFVFTDGEPDSSSAVASAVRHLNARGVETYGVALRTGAYFSFDLWGMNADNAIYCPNMTAFPHMLQDLMTRAIRRDARCR